MVGAVCWKVNAGAGAGGGGEGEGMGGKGRGEGFNWHVDGSEERLFAEKLIGGIKTFVAARVARPYVQLDQLVVHPSFRRRGVGRTLVEHVTARAEELGVQTVVVSVPFAVGMYEGCGFEGLGRVEIDFLGGGEEEGRTEKWESWVREWEEGGLVVMRRGDCGRR